jgi:hypothetical protein
VYQPLSSSRARVRPEKAGLLDEEPVISREVKEKEKERNKLNRRESAREGVKEREEMVYNQKFYINLAINTGEVNMRKKRKTKRDRKIRSHKSA